MDLDLTQQYNYDEFIPEKFERWMRFAESPALGEPASDFPLLTLEENPARLSEIWSAHPYTIVEFGSFT